MMTEEDDFRHLRWFRENGSGKTWNIIGIVAYIGGARPFLWQQHVCATTFRVLAFPV